MTLLERTNLRYLELGQLWGGALVDLVTLDLSFISVLKVLPAVCGVLAPRGALLVLIKPQFEAGREQVRWFRVWDFSFGPGGALLVSTSRNLWSAGSRCGRSGLGLKFRAGQRAVVLIKPQLEAGLEQVGVW